MRSPNIENADLRPHAKGEQDAGPRVGDEPMADEIQWLEVDYGAATFLISSYGSCEREAQEPVVWGR